MSFKILSAVNFLFFEMLIYGIISNLFWIGKEFSLNVNIILDNNDKKSFFLRNTI